MDKNKLIILLILVSSVIVLSVCTLTEPNVTKGICNNNSGNWVEEYSECEFISEELCLELSGVYTECGSACRHSEDTTIACTMQCVPLCSFN
jgi:hypothetical protein